MDNESTTINSFNVFFQFFYALTCVYTQYFQFKLDHIIYTDFLLKNMSWRALQNDVIHSF